ncbi:MAG: hypothetical protein J6V41_01075 [Kiritimatiellae bacterium]|nr:hypothetical protein [Kiritimatiellia bacterium]
MCSKNYIKKSFICCFVSEEKSLEVTFKDDSKSLIKFKAEGFKKSKRRKCPPVELDYARLLRFFEKRSYDSINAVAEEIVKVLFADSRINFFRITIIQNDKPDEVFTFSRKKMCLGPKSPISQLVVCFFVRLQGNFIKCLSRPYHLLFPKKRWSMKVLDPAKKEPKTNSDIPRKIWQTNFTEKCSFPLWINYLRNRCLSKDFEHHFFGNEDCEKFILTYGSEKIINAYKKLSDGAAKADLWRLVVLYEEGGVYMDMDASLFRPLSKIIENRDYVFLWDRKRFSNFFMATKAKNPLIKEFIDEVVYRIENSGQNKYGSVFYLTGPGAIDRVLDEKENIEYIDYHSLVGQGVFSDEKYQYIDKPNGKWIHNKNFVK